MLDWISNTRLLCWLPRYKQPIRPQVGFNQPDATTQTPLPQVNRDSRLFQIETKQIVGDISSMFLTEDFSLQV